MYGHSSLCVHCCVMFLAHLDKLVEATFSRYYHELVCLHSPSVPLLPTVVTRSSSKFNNGKALPEAPPPSLAPPPRTEEEEEAAGKPIKRKANKERCVCIYISIYIYIDIGRENPSDSVLTRSVGFSGVNRRSPSKAQARGKGVRNERLGFQDINMTSCPNQGPF